MSTIVRPALVLFAALTVICGVVYPFATAGIGQLAFNDEVNGSIVERGGKPVGSMLIGQSFTDDDGEAAPATARAEAKTVVIRRVRIEGRSPWVPKQRPNSSA